MMLNRKYSMAISHPHMPRCDSRQSQAGLTLLELLISLSLGLLLLTGIGTIYVGSNQTYRVQEQNARIQESGRYALEVIGRSLRQAGYWNIPISPVALQTAFGGTPINGANGAGTAADSVTVQYDGVAGSRDCEGTNITTAMLPVVVQDTIQLDAANFELECESNVDGTVANDPQPLVSNVEDLQFLYGIDATGDQSADRYVAAPGNWNQVVSVRACVLIRSEEQGITTSAQSFLNCTSALAGTGTLTAAADSRLRRTFMATFNLRNRVTNIP
jgi:type IV pilus assembly protein PilW